MFSLISVADFLQSLTIVISITAYLPQWRTLLKNRSSENISLSSWVLWLVSAAFTLFYAVTHFFLQGAGSVLVITSFLSFLFIVFTLALVLYFQVQAQAKATEKSSVRLFSFVTGVFKLPLSGE